MSHTAVMILNWNGQDFLEQFLPILIQYTPSALADIIIADNNSSDGSRDWLKRNHPQVRVIKLGKNYGFAEGYNRAIAACSHDNLVLLNSDIEVTDNWLPPLLASFEDSTIAAVMPKILSQTNRDQFEYAGASGGFIDRFGYPFCRGRIFDSVEKDSGQYDSPIPVFWTTGACMLIRREVFEEAGGFDPDFFVHMEEIDLCWRLQRLGYTLLVNPASSVYHVGGGTLANDSSRKLYMNYRNNLFLLYKNLPDHQLFPVLASRLILDGVAAAMYLLTGRWRYVTAVLRAHLKFYLGMRKLHAKRRQNPVQRARLRGIFNQSIVIQYFLMGNKSYKDLDL